MDDPMHLLTHSDLGPWVPGQVLHHGAGDVARAQDQDPFHALLTQDLSLLPGNPEDYNTRVRPPGLDPRVRP